ncbi:MAG: hypothetical protein KI786_16830 [Mameliella sp.]|nr:hypothetical protein [Phaeodactylibacter sp.]
MIRTTKVDATFITHAKVWNHIIFEGLPPQFYTCYDDTFFKLKEEAGYQELPQDNRFEDQAFIFRCPFISKTGDPNYTP